MISNKRGQGVLPKVIFGILILCVAIIFIFSSFAYSETQNVGDAIEQGINQFSDILYTVMGPLFSVLLGLGDDVDTNMIIILSFVLILVIIVSTLDSINLFGDMPNNQSGLLNFLIGIIVTIIGVRFMPKDIWLSLTAPSSAFVATMLVGLPFLAFIFITFKMKYPLLRKALWLFYLVFMSYLVYSFTPSTVSEFRWVYLIFWILGLIMIIAESVIRKLWFKESGKAALAKSLGVEYTISASEIKAEIKRLIKQLGKEDNEDMKAVLKKEINRLKRQFKELTGEAY